MLWEKARFELDRYLSEGDRMTPGTGMTELDVPPEELPVLGPGVPLYDDTLALIDQTWHGYKTMPPRGRQLWYLVLRLSRKRSAPGDSLKQWADWLAENSAAESRPTGIGPLPGPGLRTPWPVGNNERNMAWFQGG
jgi:hypothetical protein